MKKYGLSLDDLCEELYTFRFEDESPAGHYLVFSGETKKEAVKKFLVEFEKLFNSVIYESDDYGLLLELYLEDELKEYLENK